MGILALLPQGGPLLHPKPVLFIGDDQPQPGKFGIGGEDGVGTDAEIEFPGGEAALRDSFFLTEREPVRRATRIPRRSRRGARLW